MAKWTGSDVPGHGHCIDIGSPDSQDGDPRWPCTQLPRDGQATDLPPVLLLLMTLFGILFIYPTFDPDTGSYVVPGIYLLVVDCCYCWLLFVIPGGDCWTVLFFPLTPHGWCIILPRTWHYSDSIPLLLFIHPPTYLPRYLLLLLLSYQFIGILVWLCD